MASNRLVLPTAFRFWVKLGFINFGGPAGQIAIMHRELVDNKRWVPEPLFLRALNFSMLLPGPEATELAIYVAWRMHGIAGGIVAGAFFVIPSIFVLLLLSWLSVAYTDVPVIRGLLYGVQPVVMAIVLDAVMRVGRRTLRHACCTCSRSAPSSRSSSCTCRFRSRSALAALARRGAAALASGRVQVGRPWSRPRPNGRGVSRGSAHRAAPFPWARAEGRRNVPAAVARPARRAVRLARWSGHAGPGDVVLHPGCLRHLRRGVCRAELHRRRGGQWLRLVDRSRNGAWTGSC